MVKLNEKNAKTEKVIHLMVTSLCDRRCKYCCNNQYDLNDIPYATGEELRNAETVCITGGEPFEFSQPSRIALHLKLFYEVKNVYVYGNAWDVSSYLSRRGMLTDIDGITVSIKENYDKVAFEEDIRDNVLVNQLKSNRLYVFDGFEDVEPGGFVKIKRKWQEEFVPDPNSIFRKL